MTDITLARVKSGNGAHTSSLQFKCHSSFMSADVTFKDEFIIFQLLIFKNFQQ